MPVEIEFSDGKRVKLYRTSDVSAHQKRLERLYKDGPALCHCGPVGLEMAICKRTVRESERYYLRSHPRVADRHTKTCIYGAVPGSGGGGRGVLYDDGVLRFSLSLQMREVHDREPDDSPDDQQRQSTGGTYVRQPRNALLNVLRELWVRAALDVHDPKATVATSIAAMDLLKDAADDPTDLGKLRDSLVLVPAGGDAKVLAGWKRRNNGILNAAAANRQRVIIVAEVHKLRPVQADWEYAYPFLKALGGHFEWRASWERSVAEAVERSFEREWLLSHNDQARVLLVAMAEVDADRKRLRMRIPALLAATKEYVPVASSYELEVARALVAQRRSFRKPLFEDEQGLCPDFELLDVGDDPFVMEVFGMNTAEYVANAHDKIAFYTQMYGNHWWYWWATNAPMPPFPPPQG